VTGHWRRIGAAVAVAAWGGLAPAQLAGQNTDLPPIGYGSLRQDQVAVMITTDNLAVRAMPLDERVIRLLSPDTYSSLHALTESRGRAGPAAAPAPRGARPRAGARGGAARSSGRDTALAFVVTFFALQRQVVFSPDQVYIASQGAFFRPLAILPLTARWSESQLDQRQQAMAIYLFDASIPVMQPFTVFYGDRSSTAWENSINLLASERARALSRASQHQQP
jgi:hypothetical protein